MNESELRQTAERFSKGLRATELLVQQVQAHIKQQYWQRKWLDAVTEYAGLVGRHGQPVLDPRAQALENLEKLKTLGAEILKNAPASFSLDPDDPFEWAASQIEPMITALEADLASIGPEMPAEWLKTA